MHIITISPQNKTCRRVTYVCGSSQFVNSAVKFLAIFLNFALTHRIFEKSLFCTCQNLCIYVNESSFIIPLCNWIFVSKKFFATRLSNQQYRYVASHALCLRVIRCYYTVGDAGSLSHNLIIAHQPTLSLFENHVGLYVGLQVSNFKVSVKFILRTWQFYVTFPVALILGHHPHHHHQHPLLLTMLMSMTKNNKKRKSKTNQRIHDRRTG